MNLPDFQLHDKLFYGLDLAKKDSQLAVLSSEGKVLANFRFRSTRTNFLELAGRLRPADTIALEVSTSANAVTSIFRLNSEATVLLSNPMETRLIAHGRTKTDKVDARVLADLARVDYLPTVWQPDADTLRLRHLVTDRESLVHYKTKLKNQVHSILHRNLVEQHFSDLFGVEGRAWLDELLQTDTLDEYERDRLAFNLREIARQQTLVDDLDACIAAFISSRAALKHQLDLLVSIPGVSLASGAAILAAVGDVSRFRSRERLASYLGLTARVNQSGEKCRMGRISKKGNAYARFMTVESADWLRKSVPVYRRFYDRIARKKNHNVAKVAVARKLAELVWVLLTRNQEFVYARPRNTDEKRAAIGKLARSKASLKLARKPTNNILSGTALRGREIRQEIQRRANDEALRIKDLLALGKRLSQVSPSGFDPTRPTFTDWQTLLAGIARDYSIELARSSSKSKEVTAAV
jgi:transposase